MIGGGGGPKEIFQDFGLNWDKTKYLNSLHEQKLRKDLIQRVSIFPCRLSSTLLNNDAQQTWEDPPSAFYHVLCLAPLFPPLPPLRSRQPGRQWGPGAGSRHGRLAVPSSVTAGTPTVHGSAFISFGLGCPQPGAWAPIAGCPCRGCGRWKRIYPYFS